MAPTNTRTLATAAMMALLLSHLHSAAAARPHALGRAHRHEQEGGTAAPLGAGAGAGAVPKKPSDCPNHQIFDESGCKAVDNKFAAEGYDYCAADIGLRCDAPANKPCSGICKLYEVATTGNCAQGTDYCVTAKSASAISSSLTTIQIAKAQTPGGGGSAYPHWKIVPSVAVRGVEDVHSGSPLDSLWDDGLAALLQGQLPYGSGGRYSGGLKLGDAALMINAASERQQHQLHIHIAPVNTDIYTGAAFNGKRVHSTAPDTWVSIEDRTGDFYGVSQMCFLAPGLKQGTPTLGVFSKWRAAVEKRQWGIPAVHTSIMVYSPDWCKGAAAKDNNKCDVCLLLMGNVGDTKVIKTGDHH